MRVAWTGARMIAIAVAISLAASHGGLPGWAGAVWRVLLLGGMVNIIIAGIFEARRELALRAERQLAAAALRMRRFPVGTCNVHGTIWAGPGAGSVFEASGDHRWCPLREAPPRPEKTLATEMVTPVLERIDWRVDSSGVLRVAAVHATIDGLPVDAWQELADPGSEAEAYSVMVARGARARVLPPGTQEVQVAAAAISPWVATERLPSVVFSGISFAAFSAGVSRMRATWMALAGKMPHMPECDCGECD